MDGLTGFGTTLLTMLRDILPIAAILFGFQALVLRRKIKEPARIAMGMVLVLLGLTLFLEGLEMALFPIGRLMAQQLTAPEFIYGSAAAASGPLHWLDYLWIYVFAGAIGFSAAIAEPALLAVAIKANQVSGGTITVRGLRFAVAMGAAVGVAVGAFRIVTGMPLHWLIICGFVVVMIQTLSAPRAMIPLAYDSGPVTSSTVIVPLVVALGLGLAEAIPGRSPLLDGFGMIASTCLFPVIAVMAYAQLGEWQTRRLKRSSEQK